MNDEMTGNRWQNGVSDLIRQVKPKLIVETGVSEGVSTQKFLQALDDNGEGQLISIDPSPAYQIAHPRWTLIRDLSVNVLAKLYHEHGPFDMFVHDSDHGAECQTFEYETALRFVAPSGYILSDDITWGNHNAWPAFLARHNLAGDKIGHAGVVKLSATQPVLVGLPEAVGIIEMAMQTARDYARKVGW